MKTRGDNQTNSPDRACAFKYLFWEGSLYITNIFSSKDNMPPPPLFTDCCKLPTPRLSQTILWNGLYVTDQFFFSNLKDNILLNSHLFLLVGGRYTSLSYHYKLSIKHQITHNYNNGQTTRTYISKHIYMCTLLKKYKYEQNCRDKT